MKRAILVPAVAVAMVCSASEFTPAQAQGVGRGPTQGPALRPSPAPAFSPYMNLLRTENPTYLNYYGLVRPQLDFRQSVIGLRQDVANSQAAIQNITAPDGTVLPTTGHQSFFMNTTGYFMSIGGAAGPGRGAAGSGGYGVTRPNLGGQTGSTRPVPAGGGGAARPAVPGRR
jgi:hypothetical protein